MGEALRLTRTGRLEEATALLRSQPQNTNRSQETNSPTASTRASPQSAIRAGQAGQPIDMVPPRSPSGHWTVPEVDSPEQHDAPPTEGVSLPGVAGTMRGLLDRYAKQSSAWALHGGTSDSSPQATTALADGARFEEHSYANAAGSRRYKLFVPSGYCEKPLPLVVMLHGCKQSPDDFAAGTRMNELAEEQGFLVAYPAQSTSANASKCWNWFSSEGQLRDTGEPSLIAGITRRIMDTFVIDRARIYIAGLSAGGAAAAIMGANYPDLYAAIGVHSGLACGAAKDLPSALAAMRQGGRAPRVTGALLPTIVFHGDRDHTVNPVNGDYVIAQSKAGMALHQTTSRGQSTGGIRYTRTVHVDESGSPALEQWVLHGAGHAWSGGSAAGSYTDPRGPDASREMLRFFLAGRR